MSKQTIAAVFLSFAATFLVTASAQAQLLYATATIDEFQSPDSYDFSSPSNLPPTTYQYIGTFSFTPISAANVSSLTISGSFGNDYGLTTVLSDYYLGDTTDGEEAVEVAECDNTSDNCYSGQEGPYSWSLTLDAGQIADLATGLADGSIDFGYTWDQDTPPISDPTFGDANGYDLQYVNAGAATLDVYTPEPATFLFCFGGFAGIAALRRLRNV